MAQQEQQDVDALKRRGRRRLVGAVALVLLAVIVLPMVFDPEPRKTVPPVSVTVPARDDSTFTPKGPKPAPLPPVEKKADEPAPVAQAEPKPVPPPVKAETPKPAAKDAAKERARTEAALASNAGFVVPVGAFANPDGVVAKLSAAKMPYYTEPAPGNLTRVRAGPFPSREAADKAAARLKGLGLQPGTIINRAG